MVRTDSMVRVLLFVVSLFALAGLGVRPMVAAASAFAIAVLAPTQRQHVMRQVDSALYVARWLAIMVLLVLIGT